MKFEKETLHYETWVLEIGGKKIPFEFFSDLIKATALSLLIIIAYNIGSLNAQNYVLWNAYFHGNYNPKTGLYTNCWVFADGLNVKWECANQTMSKDGGATPPYTIK